MKHTNYPTKEYLQQYFEYDGKKLWRKEYYDTRGRLRPKYLVVNRLNRGRYCRVDHMHTSYAYHVIIWVLQNGDIPKGYIIDHIDGDTLNNSLQNLRLATQRQNSQNKQVHRNGKLYGCGYDRRKNLWRARTMINGERIWIGYYKTELEAHEGYKNYLKLMGVSSDVHFEPANSRKE